MLATSTMFDHKPADDDASKPADDDASKPADDDASKPADDDATPDRMAGTARTGTRDDADGHAGTGGTTSDEPQPRSIAKDDAFHVLQNARRRAVLRYILAHPEQDQFRMRDVAEAVAAWEHDTTVQQLMSQQRQRVYIALYQSHLPKLDDNGLIDYNQPRGIIEPTRLVAACEPFLEAGLHADTQELRLDDGADAEPADPGHSPSLSRAVSSLLTR